MLGKSGCTSAGPYGGSGGDSFSELLDDCHSHVKKIVIRSGSRVDSIQVTYKFSNDKLETGKYYGGIGGKESIVNIDVDNDEKIVSIFGRSGRMIDNIGFVTNFGTIFGPYGGNGGKAFTVNHCLLRGFFGREGSKIDSLGFYCSTPTV